MPDHDITPHSLIEGAFFDDRPVWVIVSAPHLKAAGGLGFPEFMLEQDGPLPLRFDFNLDYVRMGMKPVFLDDCLECTLSYGDGLATEIVLPYAFVMQVVFTFPLEEWEGEPDPDSEPKKAPTLKLVE